MKMSGKITNREGRIKTGRIEFSAMNREGLVLVEGIAKDMCDLERQLKEFCEDENFSRYEIAILYKQFETLSELLKRKCIEILSVAPILMLIISAILFILKLFILKI